MSHNISWAASVIHVVSFKAFAEALYVQLMRMYRMLFPLLHEFLHGYCG